MSVSLLELCPGSSPRESALTVSDRGGARLGVRPDAGLDVEESGGCEFDGAGVEEEVCANKLTLSVRNTIQIKLRID